MAIGLLKVVPNSKSDTREALATPPVGPARQRKKGDFKRNVTNLQEIIKSLYESDLRLRVGPLAGPQEALHVPKKAPQGPQGKIIGNLKTLYYKTFRKSPEC